MSDPKKPREGSLQAPTRHPIDWQSPDFWDPQALDTETHRIYDICHGCRRCFNLCDSFPKLFDLIDESPTGELDSVSSESLAPVVDSCTLCDMCYMTKCPYVPPHEFNLDFPHLMLRHKAQQFEAGKATFTSKQLVEVDRNGKLLAGPLSSIANWGIKTENKLVRSSLEKLTDIDARAELPKYAGKTYITQDRDTPLGADPKGPHYGKKVVFFATCFVNYNSPDIGLAARFVLAHNGVEVKNAYPGCCGMPLWEQGNIKRVAEKAPAIAQHFKSFIQEGYAVIALTPSCALMMKQEWPLLLPEDSDVSLLAKNTYDLSEYIAYLSHQGGLREGLAPVEGGVTIHLSCHSRAQNMGPKGAEILKHLPETPLTVIERCSGHGGTWGFMKDNFELALKVGAPVLKQAQKSTSPHILSECPLARTHIVQGLGLKEGHTTPSNFSHPVEILAFAYGYKGTQHA